MNPVVSIVMISFNHENFIEEAILSVIKQECSFPFEVIISDDCSTDTTCKIIERIIRENERGDLINFFPQNSNLGMMKNFGFALQKAKGDYIAICEGDDYWTSEDKLQRQFEILENNSSYVLSFHNATVLNEHDKSSRPFNSYSKETYKAKEQFEQWLIPTASSFFRNILPEKLPPFLQKGTHGDLALFLLLGEHGDFHCTNELMSVYRINDSGVTQTGFKGIQHNLNHIEQLDEMLSFFGNTHMKELRERKSQYLISNALLYAQKKEKKESRIALKQSLRLNPALRYRKASIILRIYFKLYLG